MINSSREDKKETQLVMVLSRQLYVNLQSKNKIKLTFRILKHILCVTNNTKVWKYHIWILNLYVSHLWLFILYENIIMNSDINLAPIMVLSQEGNQSDCCFPLTFRYHWLDGYKYPPYDLSIALTGSSTESSISRVGRWKL